MELPPPLIAYLTGTSPFSTELQAFFMSLQGCMKIRNTVNKNRQLNWFHAFCTSTLTGFAGAAFTFLWVGKPTSLLGNDLNLTACIVTFAITNFIPFDLGYKLGNFFPVKLVTTLFAQLFRALGVCKFVNIAFQAFRSAPSDYYPIPVFGPIFLGTLLGNFGGFFANGFHGYLKDGMPYPFQVGFVCATFYHFYVNDEEGVVGVTLREVVDSFGAKKIKGDLDDRMFATLVVSGFMHVVAVIQMEEFLGPKFSPFTFIFDVLGKFIPKSEIQPGDGFPTSKGISNGGKSKKSKKSKKKDE